MTLRTLRHQIGQLPQQDDTPFRNMVTREIVTQRGHEGVPYLGQPPHLHPNDDGAVVFRHFQNRAKILVGQHNEFAPSLPLPLVSFPREKFVTRVA
jgi:hypothetical protein